MKIKFNRVVINRIDDELIQKSIGAVKKETGYSHFVVNGEKSNFVNDIYEEVYKNIVNKIPNLYEYMKTEFIDNQYYLVHKQQYKRHNFYSKLLFFVVIFLVSPMILYALGTNIYSSIIYFVPITIAYVRMKMFLRRRFFVIYPLEQINSHLTYMRKIQITSTVQFFNFG